MTMPWHANSCWRHSLLHLVANVQERTLSASAKNVLRESWNYTKTFGKWMARKTGQGIVKLGVMCQGKYATHRPAPSRFDV